MKWFCTVSVFSRFLWWLCLRPLWHICVSGCVVCICRAFPKMPQGCCQIDEHVSLCSVYLHVFFWRRTTLLFQSDCSHWATLYHAVIRRSSVRFNLDSTMTSCMFVILQFVWHTYLTDSHNVCVQVSYHKNIESKTTSCLSIQFALFLSLQCDIWYGMIFEMRPFFGAYSFLLTSSCSCVSLSPSSSTSSSLPGLPCFLRSL